MDTVRKLHFQAPSVYHSGEETYAAMLDAMQRAKKSICLESYTVEDGKTANRFAGILMDRARAGIEVNFMFDSLGSFDLPGRYLRRLRESGVRVHEFSPLIEGIVPRFDRFKLRNHRKTLTVDSEVGFLGGMNISDRFLPDGKGASGWRDTHMRIGGDAAVSLERLFLNTWSRSGGPKPSPELYESQTRRVRNRVNPILGNRGLYSNKSIRHAYLRAIGRAQKSVFIANAYFLPDPAMTRALREASQRGVRVAVLTGGSKSDIPLISYACSGVYGRLLRRGIEIYEWQESVLHAKTAVIDGTWLTVGSHNLNYRSFLNNLEANACLENPVLGAEMNRHFHEDIAKAKRVDYEQWHRRSRWEKFRGRLFYSIRFFL